MTTGPDLLRERAAEARRKAESLLGPARLVTLKAKRMLAYDPIARMALRAWDESQHPRGKTSDESTPGSFAPGGGGGGAETQAQTQAAGQKTGGKKLFKPSKDVAEHIKRVEETILGKTLRNDNYRYVVGMLIKEAGVFAQGGHSPSAHTLNLLKMKIAESFYLQGKLLASKGKDAQGNAMIKKAGQLGYQLPASTPQTTVTPVPPPVPPVSKPAGTPDSSWTKVGPQKGSNPGGTYKDANGKQWYVKTPKTEDHVKQDVLGNRLYRIAGAKVPEEIQTKLDGKPAVASAILENDPVQMGKLADKEVMYEQLRGHFAVDAWLGNRDVIGLAQDNILVTGGVPFRVDQGGTLNYRAQGEKKEFGSVVTEFTSLRDPKTNAQAAKVYGPMTTDQLILSINNVLAIPDSVIATEVGKLGLPASLAETLIARKAYLEDVRTDLQKQLFESTASATKPAKPHIVQADLDKAKKTTPYPTSAATDAESTKLINDFNTKYSGKEITDQSTLEAKAVAFKEMKGQLDAIKLKNQAAQEAKAKEAALKETETAMTDFGDPNDKMTSKEHLAVLKTVTGGGGGYLKTAKYGLESMANNGIKVDLAPAQAAYISAYTGSHYGPVNKQLREGSITMEQFNFAKILSSALDKLPAYKGTTYRGTTLTEAQSAKYQVGYIVFERGFTSTSKNSGGAFGGNHRLVIESSSGRDVSRLSQHSSESEVLFKFNTVFQVTKREGNTIYLKEVS